MEKRWDMRRALFSTLVSCLLSVIATATLEFGAIAQERPDPTAPPPAPAPRQLTPEDEARRAKVIARVGDARITIGDVEDAINEQSPFLRARYRDPAQLRDFVDGMVRFELLARAAEGAHMDRNPEVSRVVKQNAVQQLIRRDFDERITPDTIPEADVQAYYDAHPEEFTREELRRAAHIQFASRAEAEQMLAQIRAADARVFRTLAREHSVDPETRLRGGDLRYFDTQGRPRNTRDPRIDEGLARVAFGLAEVGDVAAEPIQVGERWSIVKLTGQRPAEHRTIEQAAPTIRLRLWRERRQEGLETFVTRLREQTGVEVHADRMRAIRLDAPEREDGEEEGEESAPTQLPPLEAPAPAVQPAQGAAQPAIRPATRKHKHRRRGAPAPYAG